MENKIKSLQTVAAKFVKNGGIVESEIVFDKILNFIQYSEQQPASVFLRAPIDTHPSNYGPPGNPKLLAWGLLREAHDWMRVAQTIPIFKSYNLLRSFIENIYSGYYQASMMSARGVIETAAMANIEFNESFVVSSFITTLGASYIRDMPPTAESLSKIAIPTMKMLTHYRVMLQRSRTNWHQLINREQDASESGDIYARLMQKNVLTAIEKLKFPVTKYGKSARDQFELICDFVHPNRGSSMILSRDSKIESGFTIQEYSINPKCEDLQNIVTDITSVPLISSLDLQIDLHKKWNSLIESADSILKST